MMVRRKVKKSRKKLTLTFSLMMKMITDVVVNMEAVDQVNAVVSMDGVERLMTTVV